MWGDKCATKYLAPKYYKYRCCGNGIKQHWATTKYIEYRLFLQIYQIITETDCKPTAKWTIASWTRVKHCILHIILQIWTSMSWTCTGAKQRVSNDKALMCSYRMVCYDIIFNGSLEDLGLKSITMREKKLSRQNVDSLRPFLSRAFSNFQSKFKDFIISALYCTGGYLSGATSINSVSNQDSHVKSSTLWQPYYHHSWTQIQSAVRDSDEEWINVKGPGTLKGLVKLWTICLFLVLPGLQMG